MIRDWGLGKGEDDGAGAGEEGPDWFDGKLVDSDGADFAEGPTRREKDCERRRERKYRPVFMRRLVW